jgi:hypothetical protein
MYDGSVANREFVGTFQVRHGKRASGKQSKDQEMRAHPLVQHHHNDRAGSCSTNEGLLGSRHMPPTTWMFWQSPAQDIWREGGWETDGMRR